MKAKEIKVGDVFYRPSNNTLLEIVDIDTFKRMITYYDYNDTTNYSIKIEGAKRHINEGTWMPIEKADLKTKRRILHKIYGGKYIDVEGASNDEKRNIFWNLEQLKITEYSRSDYKSLKETRAIRIMKSQLNYRTINYDNPVIVVHHFSEKKISYQHALNIFKLLNNNYHDDKIKTNSSEKISESLGNSEQESGRAGTRELRMEPRRCRERHFTIHRTKRTRTLEVGTRISKQSQGLHIERRRIREITHRR